MTSFPDWEKYVVTQRRLGSGCIPTGYEFLLRAAHIQGIDFNTFQDEFDLDRDKEPNQARENNFKSIANVINQKYPNVKFLIKVFKRGSGIDKLAFIEECLTKQQPVLISIALAPFNMRGWHIVPVVDITDTELILLWLVESSGAKITKTISKLDFIQIHDEYEGGNDIAYLEL